MYGGAQYSIGESRALNKDFLVAFQRRAALEQGRPLSSELVCNVETCDVQHGVGGAILSRCAACKLAFYCSKEHQKIDWKKHKLICGEFGKTVKVGVEEARGLPLDPRGVPEVNVNRSQSGDKQTDTDDSALELDASYNLCARHHADRVAELTSDELSKSFDNPCCYKWKHVFKSLGSSYREYDESLRKPHTSSLQSLLLNSHECENCGPREGRCFYSFCLDLPATYSPIPGGLRHCVACKKCVDYMSYHCLRCDQCTYPSMTPCMHCHRMILAHDGVRFVPISGGERCSGDMPEDGDGGEVDRDLQCACRSGGKAWGGPFSA